MIDNALENPQEARRLAGLAQFKIDEGFYPGIRADLPMALRGEVAALRWSEINVDRAVWTLPAERAKEGLADRGALVREHFTAVRRAVAPLHALSGELRARGADDLKLMLTPPAA